MGNHPQMAPSGSSEFGLRKNSRERRDANRSEGALTGYRSVDGACFQGGRLVASEWLPLCRTHETRNRNRCWTRRHACPRYEGPISAD